MRPAFNSGDPGHTTEHRRLRTGVYDPRWFGAACDGTTDDSAAYAEMFAAISADTAGAEVVVPGISRLSETLEIDSPVHMHGIGPAKPGNARSGFVVDAGVTGILITSAYTLLDRLRITGAGPDSTAGANGVELYNRATLRDCEIRRFSGNGIDIDTGAGGSGENANQWELTSVNVNQNGENGVWVRGGDSNAGVAIKLSAVGNGGWGFHDKSFLGNTWIAPHVSTNGLRSRCWWAGQAWFFVHNADPAVAHTTEPGTDSTVWAYWKDKAAADSDVPSWDTLSVGDIIQGGAYKIEGQANDGVGLGIYTEGGQNPAATGPSRVVTLGGTRGAGQVVNSGIWGSTEGGIYAETPSFTIRDKNGGTSTAFQHGDPNITVIQRHEQGGKITWRLRGEDSGGVAQDIGYLVGEQATGDGVFLRAGTTGDKVGVKPSGAYADAIKVGGRTLVFNANGTVTWT